MHLQPISINYVNRGVARRYRGHAPQLSSIDWSFFMKKNWLCWNVGPALFSKVTLFSPEVLCSVGLKYMDPAAGTSSFEGDDKKRSSTFFEKKSAPSQLLCPQCKILATGLYAKTFFHGGGGCTPCTGPLCTSWPRLWSFPVCMLSVKRVIWLF